MLVLVQQSADELLVVPPLPVHLGPAQVWFWQGGVATTVLLVCQIWSLCMMTSLSLWQPSSQGPGQVHGAAVEEGGDVDQPSQHCSAHVESWEVQGSLTQG